MDEFTQEESDFDLTAVKNENFSEEEGARENSEGEEGETERSSRRKRKIKEEVEDDGGELIFCCFVCNKKFRSERGLGKHLVIHTDQKVNDFCCHECGKVFSSKYGLTMHLKQHSVKRVPNRNTKLSCPVCDKVLTSKLGLQIHIQRHTTLKPDSTSKPVAMYIPDMKEEAGGSVESNISITLEDEAVDFHCLVCGKEQSNKQALVEHMKLHNNRLKYECPECQRKLSTKGALTVHMRIHLEDFKQYACSECGKRFRAKGNMLEHERTHRDNRSFECSYCEKSFKQRSNLTVHLLLVHGESAAKRMAASGGSGGRSGELDAYTITVTGGPDGERTIMYRCPMCNKTLASKRGLSIHMQLHVADSGMTRDATGALIESMPGSEVKTLYECYVCFKLLASRAGLDKHLLTHSDDNKPLSCIRCNKRFRDARSLLAHERVHTGEKPFQCSYCDKKYAQRSNLITHLLLSHGVRTTKGNRSIAVESVIPRHAVNSVLPPPIVSVSKGSGNHLCSICAKQFSTITALAAHERIHTDIKPTADVISELLADDQAYCQCSNCGATFSSLLQFNEHMCEQSMDEPLSAGIQLVHMCAQCGDQFENETLLTNHRCSGGGVTYNCSTCGRYFANKVMLALHSCEQPTDDTSTPVCHVCNSVCASQQDLQQHLHAHAAAGDTKMSTGEVLPSGVPNDGSGDGNVVDHDATTCWQCGVRFSTSEELAVHTAEGSCVGEATLMCEACGASFDSEVAARHHVEVEHGGAKAAVADALYVCAEYEGQQYEDSQIESQEHLVLHVDPQATVAS